MIHNAYTINKNDEHFIIDLCHKTIHKYNQDIHKSCFHTDWRLYENDTYRMTIKEKYFPPYQPFTIPYSNIVDYAPLHKVFMDNEIPKNYIFIIIYTLFKF